MNVREVMTSNPICCLPGDTAQTAARMMCESNVGSIPVVSDRQSRKLTGIITDRDICCTLVAQGLDPVSTPVSEHMHRKPVACRPNDSIESCEQAMQRHQIRRIPVVDEQGCVLGIVAQADIALKHGSQQVSRTVSEISKPHGHWAAA